MSHKHESFYKTFKEKLQGYNVDCISSKLDPKYNIGFLIVFALLRDW